MRGAVAAAALAGAVVACDRSAAPAALPSRTPAEIVAAARAAGVARVRVASSVVVGGEPALAATATGLLDVAAGRSAVRIAYDSRGRDLGFVTSDEVVDGGVTYLRRPGGQWYRARAEVGGVRPTLPFDVLRDVDRLERVGEEQVGGERTVHLQGPGDGRFAGSVDVWVRGDGTPLRIRLELTVTGAVVTVVDVERWGVAERVAVPAGAEPVASIDDLYEAVGA